MKYLLIALLFAAGCSRSLPFGFSFSDHEDFGATSDLSVTGATVDLTGAPAADLAGQGHDLFSTDLAVSLTDLGGASADLRSQSDLGGPDLPKVRHPIGGACIDSTDCALGLLCANTVGGITFSGGFCTRECLPPGPDMGTLPCGDQAACVLGLANATTYICAPLCGVIDCRGGYSCCPTTGSSTNVARVCLMPGAEYCK